MAIKEDKSFTGTQIGYRSLLLEKGHGVSVSTARCLSNVSDRFIQFSKNNGSLAYQNTLKAQYALVE